jgi:beta-glucosidase
MPEASFHFPKGFLWGCATSSHQVEGNNTNNNWYQWENESDKVFDHEKSGKASDWWGGKWKDDFTRAYESGQNAHRFSIEWSRIQPTISSWNESAIERYRQMVQWLVEHHMTPMVTLHHFTDPLWLTEKCGWEFEEAPQLFNKYVAKIVDALKEYVDLWCTINEPNVYVGEGYLWGTYPPGKSDLKTATFVLSNLVRAHALAYRTIHSIQPSARVGIAIHHSPMFPKRKWFLPDRWIASFLGYTWNDSVPMAMTNGILKFLGKKITIPEAAHTLDFFGFNYYDTQEVKFTLKASDFFSERTYPREAEVSEHGDFACFPPGMFESLKWAKTYGLPIYITENGIEDTNDTLRPRYLLQHIHQLWRGVNFNWQVKGYFHWSLVDNFEWQAGWSERFGLWGLDIKTQTRIRHKSADLYTAICKENGINPEIVKKYTPELISKIYPD